jgi:hypothetical protein
VHSVRLSALGCDQPIPAALVDDGDFRLGIDGMHCLGLLIVRVSGQSWIGASSLLLAAGTRHEA